MMFMYKVSVGGALAESILPGKLNNIIKHLLACKILPGQIKIEVQLPTILQNEESVKNSK